MFRHFGTCSAACSPDLCGMPGATPHLPAAQQLPCQKTFAELREALWKELLESDLPEELWGAPRRYFHRPPRHVHGAQLEETQGLLLGYTIFPAGLYLPQSVLSRPVMPPQMRHHRLACLRNSSWKDSPYDEFETRHGRILRMTSLDIAMRLTSRLACLPNSSWKDSPYDEFETRHGRISRMTSLDIATRLTSRLACLRNSSWKDSPYETFFLFKEKKSARGSWA
eukprot:gene17140-biopygen1274